MGVDYSAVGGIGVKVTPKMLKVLRARDTENEDDYDILDSLGLRFEVGGSGAYTGKKDNYYLMADGNNLGQVIKGADKLHKKLKELGIDIPVDKFEVIEDLHVC